MHQDVSYWVAGSNVYLQLTPFEGDDEFVVGNKCSLDTVQWDLHPFLRLWYIRDEKKVIIRLKTHMYVYGLYAYIHFKLMWNPENSETSSQNCWLATRKSTLWSITNTLDWSAKAFQNAWGLPIPTAERKSDSLSKNSVLKLVRLFRETPYGGKLWFRYNREFTANTNTPPVTGMKYWSALPTKRLLFHITTCIISLSLFLSKPFHAFSKKIQQICKSASFCPILMKLGPKC